MKKIKTFLFIIIIVAIFIGILYKYGAIQNHPTMKGIDKSLAKGLNEADKEIDKSILKQAAKTILNKHRYDP